MKFSHLTVLAFLHASDAFQVPIQRSNGFSTIDTHSYTSSSALLLASPENPEDFPERPRSNGLRKLFSKTKKSLAFLTVASSAMLVVAPQTAQASAPVMAMPKADARDPLKDALENHQRKMRGHAQEELRQMNAKARQVEAEEGGAAREEYELEYKANQEKLAQERLDSISKLKYDLLDQGICPFADVEGQRQVYKAEKGIDPAEVPGTGFYVEKGYETKSPQKSYAYLKQPNRVMVKAMVQDMKNRGMDPLEYFEKHIEKTLGILDLPAAQAATLATKYQANIEEFGQISPPKEGEMSAKEKMAKSGKSGGSTAKVEAKRLKTEAKAKAVAEKAAAKAKAKGEKAKAKAEAQVAKETFKKEQETAKATAIAAAAAAAAAVGAAEMAASVAVNAVESTGTASPATPEQASVDQGAGGEIIESPEASASISKGSSKKGVPIIPVVGGVVAVGGGGYALKILKDKAADDEEERQRQFKLLMGGMAGEGGSPTSAPALEEVEPELSDFAFEDEKTKQSAESEISQVSQSVPKRKKRRGIKSVFGKSGNSRETDVNALISSDAKAPEFAKLLSKTLTFGAPGRFPGVISLPGDMPMQEFDVDTACTMLTETQNSAGLTKAEAAEVFANVVNCMLIDIVDLASTSLKEKDSKVTVDAIGIVVDFMNHAASLYNSIAEGVVITPVTYGGDLGKGKLEQMYSAYAGSGMTNMMGMDGDFEDRVNLLRDVFQINEKKAEGLMMKVMQKNMMEMMKDGEGMEGMEEMMKGMGMDGMNGMPGMGLEDGEEPNPEQLKEMLTTLKTLKDSGAIPPEELEEVRKQFKESFGSSIDEVINDADGGSGGSGLDTQDKELLDLMKSVLYD